MKKIIILSSIFFFLITGCSLFKKVDVNGTYHGTIEGTQNSISFSMSITMTLSQNGNNVSGTWTVSGGTSGTLSGKIAGNKTADFNIIQTSPCSGTFIASAIIHNKGDEITGEYHGSSCLGTVSASFDVYK